MELRQYLLAKPEAWEDFPFGKEVMVFKIDKKMFALLSDNIKGRDKGNSPFVNLKCDPDQAFILRDIFPAVKPAYHMNKRHWNSVYLDGSIPQGELERMVDHSYSLVVKGLSRTRRRALELSYGQEKLYCE